MTEAHDDDPHWSYRSRGYETGAELTLEIVKRDRKLRDDAARERLALVKDTVENCIAC